MKTYAINLCTDTKNTDRYDKVAVNKFPIIVRCEDFNELKYFLQKEDTINFVKELLKQKHLYETAVYYIREVDKGIKEVDKGIKEDRWVVKDITPIQYDGIS